MSIATAALGAAERRLPKVIDARTHGILDYCHAAFFLGMAIYYARKNRRAARAALATGAFLLAESLLTDYPAGAAKAISFETHGRIDSALTASSFMMPRLFGFSGTAAAEVFKINGFLEGAVVGMTDWKSERARGEKSPVEVAAD
jgi:uncharacterized protein YaiE (UPF0345 family)